MQTDPASLDPEEKLNKFYALFSITLGIFSLCSGVIPALGVIVGSLGLFFGYFGRRSENKKIAIAGMGLSCIGILTAFIYSLLLYFNT